LNSELIGSRPTIIHYSSFDPTRSGKLIGFQFFGQNWPLEPKTIFYDWIYLNALNRSVKLISDILKYEAFTDIEFNPLKSINCQAYSAALYVSLFKRGIISNALSNHISFKKLMGVYENEIKETGSEQLLLPGFNQIFE